MGALMPRTTLVKLDSEKVRRGMKRSHLSTTGLIGATGISATTIYRALRGDPLGAGTAARLADAIGAELGELVQASERRAPAEAGAMS